MSKIIESEPIKYSLLFHLTQTILINRLMHWGERGNDECVFFYWKTNDV